MTNLEINDNNFLRQFEVNIDGQLAKVEYALQERKIFLTKIMLPENTSDKAAKQYVNEREGKVGGNSSRKGTGRKQKTTGRLMTNRSTSRSTARRTGRSSYRGSTGRSSIATIDTEMADLIRETAESELKQLREALQRETELRGESDKKIELLLHELQSLKK